jgi:hypothetical protein
VGVGVGRGIEGLIADRDDGRVVDHVAALDADEGAVLVIRHGAGTGYLGREEGHGRDRGDDQG